MGDKKPTYEELQARLEQAESVIEALRSGKVDAIVGQRDVALVRLREAEEKLKRLNLELEERVLQRTSELEVANRALSTALSELQAAHIRMMEVERLTALGTLAATVAHEVNSPLMGVMNAVACARRHATDSATAEALDEARTELHRIEVIVQNLLRWARPPPQVVRPEPVAEVVRRALFLLEPEFKAQGITVTTDIPASLPPVAADGSRLEQVVLNLLSNARDAVAGCPTKQIRLAVRPEGQWVYLEVADSGVGISEEAKEKLFDPFFTTKPGQGTGLGLPVSKSIVDGFGGAITLHSRPGEGATFTVRVPVARENGES